jgi:hypothetical protein
MKRTISGALLTLIVILFSSGCGTYKYHPNIKARYLPQDASIKLNVTHPVAIKNVSSSTPGAEGTLCEYTKHFVVTGNLYAFTEATIGTVKEALQRNNITIDDKADKRLELSVDRVICDSGWEFSSGIILKVRTGNGLEKEYRNVQKHGTGYSSTRAFELAMVQCVEQMLKDKDIVGYLEQ